MNSCIRCHAELPPQAIYCPVCGKHQTGGSSSASKKKTLKRANGTGTVYKLQGRRRRPWVAAKNKTIIGYYERRTDALEALEKLSGKNISDRYNLTFAEVFEYWKAEHYPQVQQGAICAYDGAFKVFSSLHGRKFRDLRTADYQAIIDAHLNLSRSSLSAYKKLITQMSKWAIREELITTNFASFVRLPKAVPKEKETFSAKEIEALESDGSETAKIVLMLIYTGMRINELFSLPLEDYHGNYVIGGEKTAAGRNRIIPIRPEGRAYFAYFAEHATGELLLSGYVGHLNIKVFRSKDYYPLLERCGIKRKTPHCTRHTYASRAVSEGMPPEILQKILGHAKYSTTAEIYVHSDLEHLLKAVER